MELTRVAVVLRKAQHGVSMADEHDSERIEAYCRELGPACGLAFDIVLPERREGLDRGRWEGVFFVGADDFVRRYIERDDRPPVFLWAKGYDLTIDPVWRNALGRVHRFFNSSYLTGREEPWNDRTRYVPTAFHDPWPAPLSERSNDLRNRLMAADAFDLVFSGSDRHVRTDRYRQRLLGLLAKRGLKICIAAPRSVWNRPHQGGAEVVASLDPSIQILGNWGTERIFQRAACVLDLPWLDNYFPDHPAHQNPNDTIFALGWNIFRAGAYGARVLTFDCPANRDLGLTDSVCRFYTSGLADLDALADEIAAIVRRDRGDSGELRRQVIRDLFHRRHTYRERWHFMCEELAGCYTAREMTATHVSR